MVRACRPSRGDKRDATLDTEGPPWQWQMGGGTWHSARTGAPAAPLTAVIGIGSSAVYAVGLTRPAYAADASPFVAVSTDGGTTFTPTYPPFAGGLNGVTADAAGNVLAVGAAADGGFFAWSEDGAATWTRTAVPGTDALYGIWAAADGTIYACGELSRKAAAEDGGAPGASQDGGGDGYCGQICGDSSDRGVVLRSIDGGATWVVVATAPGSLYSISGTADDHRIIAVGVGYSDVELPNGDTAWIQPAGDSLAAAKGEGALGSVWIADATSNPFIAMGGSGEVLRWVFGGGSQHPPTSMDGEVLPPAGLGLQSGAVAVAGTSLRDVWAVGSGIFHRTSR